MYALARNVMPTYVILDRPFLDVRDFILHSAFVSDLTVDDVLIFLRI